MRLSIAMIVKNEQKNLWRCLESVRGLNAELIVVDTGSVDQTVRIAKEFGAKLYYHPWENNFAKHRNQSFSYATGDWIYQLDADEEFVYLKNSTPLMFLKFLEMTKKEINAIALACTDIVGGKDTATTQHVRFFRNGKVKYKRAIHNEPVYKGDTGLCTFVKFNHYGYDLDPFEKEIKAKRTISLLKETLQKNPHDYDSMFYLSQAYGSFAENPDKALEWAIKYAKKRKKIRDGKFHRSVYWSIIAPYLNRQDPKNAWKWLEIALKELPNDLDISMALLRYGVLTKNQNLVGAGARGFVNAYHDFEKHMAERASQFVFNRNENAYAYALFHLATTYLEHSKDTLNLLYKAMDDIPNSFREELREGLKLWFNTNDSIFKHHNAMLQATETARALYSFRPKSNREGLRTAIHQR